MVTGFAFANDHCVRWHGRATGACHEQGQSRIIKTSENRDILKGRFHANSLSAPNHRNEGKSGAQIRARKSNSSPQVAPAARASTSCSNPQMTRGDLLPLLSCEGSA